MKGNDKLVLILENSGSSLVKGDSGDYVLEGIFAQFGVENNNNRIYEEKEYLPHLDYLKKKIEQNRLLGELDHPDKFDISLSKVSHLIEDVRYDSKKRQIVGKIRLLDTPSGQIAKNLVDTGVPISISSRAAGVVGENKKVQIKRIFTYDLVADPGFENAQMKKINESLGYGDSDNFAIYDMTEAFPEFLSTFESEDTENNKPQNTKTNMPQDYVSIEEMNKYSLVIKEEFEKITKRLEEASSIAEKDVKIKTLSEELKHIKEFTNYLAEKLDGGISYIEHVAEKADSGIQYSESVAEKLDQSIAYTESIAEKADQGIAYSEHIAEKADQGIKYANYLSEKVNSGLNFANYLAEKMNETIGYAEHIAEHSDNVIRYTEYLAENATSNKDFKSLTEYAEYMFESMHGGAVKGNEISEDKNKNNKGILSGAVSEGMSVTARYTSLNGKIEAVLESLQNQKSESSSEDSKYPFIKFLNESKRSAFLSLNETEKEKVNKALNISPAYSQEGIVAVWENALASVEVNEKWLTNMPVEYLPIWESSTPSVKDRIIRQAKLYNLQSDYQVKNFWQTRGLDKPADAANAELNESKREELNSEKISALGYSNDFVKMIGEGMNRYNR